MKAILLPALFTVVMAATLPAQTCREVVRDDSGRLSITPRNQRRAWIGGTKDMSDIVGALMADPNKMRDLPQRA